MTSKEKNHYHETRTVTSFQTWRQGDNFKSKNASNYVSQISFRASYRSGWVCGCGSCITNHHFIFFTIFQAESEGKFAGGLPDGRPFLHLNMQAAFKSNWLNLVNVSKWNFKWAFPHAAKRCFTRPVRFHRLPIRRFYTEDRLSFPQTLTCLKKYLPCGLIEWLLLDEDRKLIMHSAVSSEPCLDGGAQSTCTWPPHPVITPGGAAWGEGLAWLKREGEGRQAEEGTRGKAAPAL